MYTGILQLTETDDEFVQEIIAACDYFQMTALIEAFDQTYRHRICPSNVLSWSKVADLYSLPLLMEMCDRIKFVKFKQVIKQRQFLKLSRDEVLMYFRKCTQFLEFCRNDLLWAALIWMDNNEQFPELVQLIDLDRCSRRALEAAIGRAVMPQLIATQIEGVLEKRDMKQDKEQTLVYIAYDESVIVDKYECLCLLDKFNFDYDTDEMTTYNVRYTDDGYVFVHEITDDDSKVQVTIRKYDTVKGEFTTLPGEKVKKLGITYSIIHKSNFYMISRYDKDSVFCYNMKTHVWSEISVPAECSDHLHSWKGAIVGDDLYFMDRELHFFRYSEEKFERIRTEMKRTDIKEHSRVRDFSITAVHRWLYIFAMTYDREDLQVYSYDTTSGIWTDILIDFSFGHDLGCMTTTMFGTKIYIAGLLYCLSGFYEYDLLDDLVKESTRLCPKTTNFHMSVINVPTNLLEANPPGPTFDDDC